MMWALLLSLAQLWTQFVVLCLSNRRASCRQLSHPWMTTSMSPSLARAALGRSSFPCPRRTTSSLFQDFSTPSSTGCSSGGHFLFLLLLVLSRSYSYTLVNIFSSMSLWFKYSLSSHTFIVRIRNHVVIFLSILRSVQGVSWASFLFL